MAEDESPQMNAAGRFVVIFAVGLMVIVVLGIILLVTAISLYSPSYPPYTEQTLAFNQTTIQQTGDGTVHIEAIIRNSVQNIDSQQPKSISNPSIVGYDTTGNIACRASVDGSIAPNETATVEFTCDTFPMLLSTQIAKEGCRGPGDREIGGQSWGYLGRNNSGHQWITISENNCEVPSRRKILLAYLSCQQRRADLNVSAIAGDKFWLHEAYSVPAVEHDYTLTVQHRRIADHNLTRFKQVDMPTDLTYMNQSQPKDLSAVVWYRLVSSFEGEQIDLRRDLPSDERDHVTVYDTHRTGCELRDPARREYGSFQPAKTNHSGYTTISLRYVAPGDPTYAVTLTRNVSYRTQYLSHGQRFIYIRHLNESDILEMKHRGWEDHPTLVTVAGVNRSGGEIRYTTVDRVPGPLRQALPRARESGSTQIQIYARDNKARIMEAIDDKDLHGNGFSPSGARYYTERGEYNKYFVVMNYGGEYYYLVLYHDQSESPVDPKTPDHDP